MFLNMEIDPAFEYNIAWNELLMSEVANFVFIKAFYLKFFWNIFQALNECVLFG